MKKERQEKIIKKIEAFFDWFEKAMDKYPIFRRLMIILFVIGVIIWIASWIVWGFATVIVWFITAMAELCLIPVHFLIWLCIGKFPMFDMHEYILKKLRMFDLVYQKS